MKPYRDIKILTTLYTWLTNHVYNDHVSSDMTKEEFRNVCKLAWEKPYGFVVVNLTSNKDNGKYRIELDTFYIPN